MIRVLVVEDHPAMREGLAEYLSEVDGMEVVEAAACGEAALACLPVAQPDVVLLDYALPDMRGVEVAAGIKARAPSVRVLIFSAFDDALMVEAVLAAGACGWLLKTEALETLLDAVRAVARGEMYFSPAVLPAAMQIGTEGGAHSVLSPRQAQILQQVAGGKSSIHIANELGISQRTVDEHLGHVLQKLGASSRAEAVAIALRRGLIA